MKKSITKALLTAAALTTALSGTAYAQEDAPNFNETLTGDWAGARTKLYNAGIDVSAVYTADYMANVGGGVREEGEFLDNADLIFTIDGEKLYNLKGSTISLYFINNNGGRPNDHVGSVQGVDNIEVSDNTAKLFEAWIEQKFANDTASVRAGLYNLNSEFYVTDSSAIFLNSTFGIGTEVAQTGQNGPSIFPTSSLGVRAKWEPTPEFYVQAAVLDGVPGDPNDPDGTHIELNGNDGALFVAEAGYNFSFAKLSLGGWAYSEEFDDLTEVDGNGDPVQQRNQGVYAMAEKEFSEHLTAFGRIGFASEDVNQSDYSWATGINLNKVIPRRDDAVVGLAITGAHNSSKYETANAADSAETAIELTYSDQLTPWLTIQPDVQYTINPGTDPALDNSTMVGVRMKAVF